MTAIKAILAVLLVIGVCQAAPEAAGAQPTCFATLPTALTQLGLAEMTGLLPKGNLTSPVLDESIPLTLFAPSSEAWLERAPQLGLVAGDIVGSARANKITFILQHHVVEGAAVDYSLAEARAFPLSSSLSSSPCVPVSPVTVNVTDTPLGLLVQSLGTSALVKSTHDTCGNIAKIYVIDDVLNPCCTNMFDIVKSPTLAPVFNSRIPIMKAFANYFNAPLFNEVEKTWNLPPTLFIPTADALLEYLTAIKEMPEMDAVTLNLIQRNITWQHMSSVAVTKESLLLGPASRTILTFLKIKDATCPTGITLTLRDPTDKVGADKGYLGTASAGKVTANILKGYKMCNGTTVYIVDKVLAPCDLTKYGACKGFSNFQKRPAVKDAFASNNTDVSQFMDYYTGALWNPTAGSTEKWSLPNTLFVPSSIAIEEFVAGVAADQLIDESDRGAVYNITALTLMTDAKVNNETLSKGSVVGTTRAYEAYQQTCLKTITAADAPTGPVTVTIGSDSANIMETFQLCGNTTVHILDKVLVPCKLDSIVPCRSFDDLQKKALVAQAFNSTDGNVTQMMDYFTGALWDGESSRPGWKLPPTIFIPTAAAIKEYVADVLADAAIMEDSQQLQNIWNATAGLHMTKGIINNATLARSPTINATSFASAVFNDSCLKTLTVKSTPAGLTVTGGVTTAKVVQSYVLCDNVTVYVIDTVLKPCNLTTITTPEDAARPRCKKFYSITGDPDMASIFNSSDKNLKTFMNYFTGPIYDKATNDWILPETLFIPAADTMAPFLTSSIGKNVNSEKAKKLYAILYYLHQTNQTITLGEAMNATSGIPVTSQLVSKTDCQNKYTITPEAINGDVSKVRVTITAGGSKATVINHWELCDNKQVYLIDQPLVPCDIGKLIKSYKAPKEFGKSRGSSAATLPRSLSVALTLFAAVLAAAFLL